MIWRSLTIIVGLVFGVGLAVGQPDAVARALADLNTRTGRALTLNDLNWRYSQEVYDGNNLGCPFVPNTSGGPVSIVGYQVEFDEGYDDTWEWDYRLSEDGTILLLCTPPTPTPGPTLTPAPTATPLPTLTTAPSLTPTIGPTPTYTPQPTPAVFACIDLPPRLVVGTDARVTPGLPNILRDRPTPGGGYLADIPGEATVFVVGGPTCAEGYIWWEVEYQGARGWTIETFGEEYVLEPILFFPTVITPSNAARLNRIDSLAINARAIYAPSATTLAYIDTSGPQAQVMTQRMATASAVGASLLWIVDPPRLADVVTGMFDSATGALYWLTAPTPGLVDIYDDAGNSLTVIEADTTDLRRAEINARAGWLLALSEAGLLTLFDIRPDVLLETRTNLAPLGQFADADLTGGDFGLFAALDGSTVNFYDAAGQQIFALDTGLTVPRLDFALNGSAGVLVVSGVDAGGASVIQVWDAGGQVLRHTLRVPDTAEVATPVLHPHTTLVGAINRATSGPHLMLWDTATGAVLFDEGLNSSGGLLNEAAFTFSRDGSLLLVWGDNGQVNIWATNY